MAPATRTQVYLTAEQRELIERRRHREGKSMAEVVREAIDAYLAEESTSGDVERVLDETFGACPEFTVPPREEWDRGYG